MNLEQIKWTVEDVEEWLQIATMVDRCLPPVYHKGVSGQKWNILREWYELLWDDEANKDRKPTMQPTNQQVSMWEEVVLRWFNLIPDPINRRILWMRSCGLSWPKIGKRVHLSRQTTALRYGKTLEALTEDLWKFYHKIS